VIVPRGHPVDGLRHHREGSAVLRLFSLPACCRHYPGGPVGSNCSGHHSPKESDGGGLPLCTAGSASANFVSGPARRSPVLLSHITACWLAEPSSDGPLSSKASVDSLPPRPFRLLPGGTINFPGGTHTRWRTAPSSRRTARDSYCGRRSGIAPAHDVARASSPVPDLCGRLAWTRTRCTRCAPLPLLKIWARSARCGRRGGSRRRDRWHEPRRLLMSMVPKQLRRLMWQAKH